VTTKDRNLKNSKKTRAQATKNESDFAGWSKEVQRTVSKIKEGRGRKSGADENRGESVGTVSTDRKRKRAFRRAKPASEGQKDCWTH